MGFIKQLRRALKNSLGGLFKKKEKLPRGAREPLREAKIPASWQKPEAQAPVKKDARLKVIPQNKVKVPGLRTTKRIIWGFLLLFNFIFSQFLLGAVGSGGQPMFFLFLLNSWAIVELLWKTRGKKDE